MKRSMLLALCFLVLTPIAPAQADWRWAPPKFKRDVTYKCTTFKCIRATYIREKKRYVRKVKLHDKRRLAEWKRWTRMPIPTCTWYGESGEASQYARVRYTMPNSEGSGAYGKYQMMPGTYASRAKYRDWSPLDQEIAGHREFQANGIGPWSNCTG